MADELFDPLRRLVREMGKSPPSRMNGGNNHVLDDLSIQVLDESDRRLRQLHPN